LSKWSRKLDNYLAVNKISKRQLASELGVSINTLQKWWGSREPSLEHAVKIQELLGENVSTTTTIVDESYASPEKETKDDQVVASQLPKQGERGEHRSVVVSLLRTTCPFCKNTIAQFGHCAYCGQHFVWANIPIDKALHI
jgi:transcriptional regulator with XRE-family HTH domain